MKSKRRIIIFAFLFIISIANFNRIQGNENIRNIQFVSIFMMGLFAGLLVMEIINAIKNKQADKI